ncbi:MAG TPA: helix-turn-helix transcriptional regulator [Candidatus Parabacteroides intestinigallinarum]|uniref:Helix-turn-helix transcriptional regulator n=1 Tax=Candidatus Parabacteroides intestinigallinarum TaxID=2838722 RepID=A0A9D2BPX6_9BACT|nr:helix-turn-helix transcriptional regulator [Candidatus Parabacteroides intestinigallinarum]
MDRTMIEDAVFPGCPIRNILSKLCDKWSLLVIYTLDKSDKRTIRFKELQREIPDISQKMLTVTLRTLESDGYVTRTVYPEVPPRVEYALTARTRSLLPHINALIGWALENMDAIMKDRKKAHGR